MDDKGIDKAQQAPFRVPLIIVVVTYCDSQNNVPHCEQVVSAGCTVHAMQMVALAQVFNSIWRTGVSTSRPDVRAAFVCREQDEIVGFLYFVTPQLKASTTLLPPDTDAFVRRF